jgi:hypothetical protein
MGFRFSRRIKIIPGVTLNVSKSGVSTSVGVKGAHVTLGGPRGTRAMVGIPGTGISYTETHKAQASPPVPVPPRRASGVFVLLLILLGAIALVMMFPGLLGK